MSANTEVTYGEPHHRRENAQDTACQSESPTPRKATTGRNGAMTLLEKSRSTLLQRDVTEIRAFAERSVVVEIDGLPAKGCGCFDDQLDRGYRNQN